jgi:mono/diheme cytochrome c family protein
MKPNRILLLIALVTATAAQAAPADFLKDFETQARAESPAFKGFSAERGAQFYRSKHGAEWSCASCHTDNPAAAGKHAKTDKEIKPMAPAANPERFSDAAKVEKWFKRNCGDVLNRACTAQEKGDFLSYLISVRK